MLGKSVLNATYHIYGRELTKCVLKWRALLACSRMKINECLVSIERDVDFVVLATSSGDHNPYSLLSPVWQFVSMLLTTVIA